MADVTVINGTTTTYRDEFAALRGLLRALTPAQLHWMSVYGIRDEQLRRAGRYPKGTIGEKAVPEKPYVTDV